MTSHVENDIPNKTDIKELSANLETDDSAPPVVLPQHEEEGSKKIFNSPVFNDIANKTEIEELSTNLKTEETAPLVLLQPHEEEWLKKIINSPIFNENAFPNFYFFDLDETLLKEGFGGRHEDLVYYSKIITFKKFTEAIPHSMKERIPSSLLKKLKTLHDNNEALFIVSFNKAGETIIYDLLYQRCMANEEIGTQLFSHNRIFCFPEIEKDNDGKNVHILMAYLALLEEKAGIKATAETYEIKYTLAQLLYTVFLDRDYYYLSLPESLQKLADFFVKLKQVKNFKFYDDDVFNCKMAVNYLGIQAKWVDNFNLEYLIGNGVSLAAHASPIKSPLKSQGSPSKRPLSFIKENQTSPVDLSEVKELPNKKLKSLRCDDEEFETLWSEPKGSSCLSLNKN